MHPDQDVDSHRSSSPRGVLWLLAIAGGIVLLVYLVRVQVRQHPGVGQNLSKLSVGALLNAEESLTLSDVRGKVTLINFWGPWCPPCLQELPELLKLERKYRGRDDVQIVLVSASQNAGDSLDELRDDTSVILQKQKADPPVYEDEDADTIFAVIESARLDGFGFPTTILIDGQGTILGVWTGYNPHFVSEMEQAIEAAVKS